MQETPLEPGWLDQTLRAASVDVLRWPSWMKDAGDRGRESYTIEFRCGCTVDGFSEDAAAKCRQHNAAVQKTTVVVTYD